MQYTNPNLTEIIAVLDRSGSMYDCINDVIGGFNQMIEDQKKVPGECRVTLVIFDHDIDTLYDNVLISEVEPLNLSKFYARGNTRLADALGSTIAKVGARLNLTPFERRPGKIVVFVSTDGEENSSKEFTTEKVQEIVKHQQEKYQWSFIFTGADIDSYASGSSLGFQSSTTMNYAKSAVGVRALYSTVSDKISDYRQGSVASVDFTADEKAKVEQHVRSDGVLNNV